MTSVPLYSLVFFSGILEYVVGKFLLGCFFIFVFFVSFLLKSPYFKKSHLLIFGCLAFFFLILWTTGILDASKLAVSPAVYNGIHFVILFSAALINLKQKSATSDKVLLVFVLLSLIVAFLQEWNWVPILTPDSKPAAFTSGALVFGFVCSLSILVYSRRAQWHPIFYLILVITIFGVDVHRSKAFFSVAALLVGFRVFELLFESKKKLGVDKFLIAFISGALVSFFIARDIIPKFTADIFSSERGARIMSGLSQLDLFGGGWILTSGPFGTLGSIESYILYLYGTFSVFGIVLFLFVSKRFLTWRSLSILLLLLAVTEPMLSYVSIAFFVFLSYEFGCSSHRQQAPIGEKNVFAKLTGGDLKKSLVSLSHNKSDNGVNRKK